MPTKGEQAKALFWEGYNCCQAVFCAFCAETGLPRETAARLASGLGGGMGRMREVCGACSGMFLAAGLLYGYHNPLAREEKTETYAMIQTLAQQFRAVNGSIICRELLGLTCAEGTAQAQPRTPDYYKKRPCAQIVAQAADLLGAYMEAHPR